MRTTYKAIVKRLQANKGAKITWPHFQNLCFLSKDKQYQIEKIDESSCESISQEMLAGSNEEVDCYQSNSSEKDWSFQKEATLIDFYESHPQLWDHKNPEYSKASKGHLMDLLVSELYGEYTGK